MPFSGSKCYTCLPCSLVRSCCNDFLQKEKKKKNTTETNDKFGYLDTKKQTQSPTRMLMSPTQLNTAHKHKQHKSNSLKSMGDVYCIYYLLPWMQKLMTVCRSHKTIIHLIIWSFLLDGFMAMKMEWNTGHVNSGSIMTVLFGFCFRII